MNVLISEENFCRKRRSSFESSLAEVGDFDCYFNSSESEGEEYGLGAEMISTNPIYFSPGDAEDCFEDAVKKWLSIGLYTLAIIDYNLVAFTSSQALAEDFRSHWMHMQPGSDKRSIEYLYLPDAIDDGIMELLRRGARHSGFPGISISADTLVGSHRALVFPYRTKSPLIWESVSNRQRNLFLDQIASNVDQLTTTGLWKSRSIASASYDLGSSDVDADESLVESLFEDTYSIFPKKGKFFRSCITTGEGSLRSFASMGKGVMRLSFGDIAWSYEKYFECRHEMFELPGLEKSDYSIPFASKVENGYKLLFFWDVVKGECKLGVRVLDQELDEEDVSVISKMFNVKFVCDNES